MNVDAAIDVALAKLPADRFSTAVQFGDALTDAGFTGHASSVAAADAGVGPPALNIDHFAQWNLCACRRPDNHFFKAVFGVAFRLR